MLNKAIPERYSHSKCKSFASIVRIHGISTETQSSLKDTEHKKKMGINTKATQIVGRMLFINLLPIREVNCVRGIITHIYRSERDLDKCETTTVNYIVVKHNALRIALH